MLLPPPQEGAWLGSPPSDLAIPSSGKRKKRAEAALGSAAPSELARATVALRMRSSAASSLSHAAYQARLLAASALCCAWSPALPPCAGPSGARSCALLAVGAKCGCVWLWRYLLPTSYSPYPAAAEEQGSGQQEEGGRGAAATTGGGRFELLGSVQAGPASCWVTALQWAQLPSAAPDGSPGALALVVGGSDGAVRILGGSAAALAAAPLAAAALQQQQQQQQVAGASTCSPPPGLPLEAWGEALPADLRGVAALSACLQDAQLFVAAGKSVGTLAVWASGKLPPALPADVRGALAGGARAVVARGLHSTHALTGVAWLPLLAHGAAGAAASGPLLVSCSRDGALKTWSVARAEGAAGALALRPARALRPCSRRKKGEPGYGAWGVAASPSGLLVAVARHALPPGAEFRL